ncbi:hypothetical protein [Sphingobacterium anhuiense]|uniref:Uncharacterized protein n=1 Tax=Sphingobacterium anhuiense TaxID=493780 RepID=A0ABW5YQ46_9SPHI
MRSLLLFVFLLSMTTITLGQETTIKPIIENQSVQKYAYAYIVIKGKFLSKKLKVNVDFGETKEQIKAGKEYSDFLTNKTSYAAILNHMVDNNFELVETLDYNDITDGSGGTTGIVFIMRRKL